MIKLLSIAAAGGLALCLAGAPAAEATPRKAAGITQEQPTEFSSHRRRYRAYAPRHRYAYRHGPRYRYAYRYGPRYRYVRRYYGPRYRYVRPYYAYAPYYRPAPYVGVGLPGFYFGFGGW